MIGNGYVFTRNGSMYMVVGSAISGMNQELLYLCQEMREGGQLLAWTEYAIMGTTAPQPYIEAASERKTAEPVSTIVEVQAEVSEQDSAPDLGKLELFLDSDSCYRKLEILQSMKSEMTESVLDAMSVSLDFENSTGSVEEKYFGLERYLKTRIRFEGKR